MKTQQTLAAFLVLASCWSQTTVAQDEDNVIEERAIVVSASDDMEGGTSVMAFEMSDANGPMILADGFNGNFDFSMGAAGNNFSMLNDSSVQQDLQLVDEQLDQIKQINKDFGEQIKEQIELMKDENGSFNIQGGSNLGELIRDLKQQQQEQISSILLPEQQNRLDQVSRQMRMKQLGTSKSLSGKLAEELGITADQKKKINAKSKELKQKLDKKIAELQAKAREELLNELTAKQKEKLKVLLGETFVKNKKEEKRKFRMFGADNASNSGDF